MGWREGRGLLFLMHWEEGKRVLSDLVTCPRGDLCHSDLKLIGLGIKRMGGWGVEEGGRGDSLVSAGMVWGFYFILFYFILFYFILFYFILFYFILFYFILFYFILFYFILFYFIYFFSFLFFSFLFFSFLFFSFFIFYTKMNDSNLLLPHPPISATVK